MTRCKGFTLAELAIVMLVFSILLGGMFVSISTQLDLRNIADTQKNMDQVREALIGFAVARGYLPCPATATSNVANSPTGNGSEPSHINSPCTVFDGYVPAVTLSLTPTDAQGFLVDSYGTRIRYAVTRAPQFTTTDPTNQIKQVGISALPAPATPATEYLVICSTSSAITASDCSGASTRLTYSAVAVIYSLGKNARSPTGGTGADESKNLDGNLSFVHHDIADSTAVNGEFDDLLTWLSPNILYNRLIAAGAI